MGREAAAAAGRRGPAGGLYDGTFFVFKLDDRLRGGAVRRFGFPMRHSDVMSRESSDRARTGLPRESAHPSYKARFAFFDV